jgi:hypothetical protein
MEFSQTMKSRYYELSTEAGAIQANKDLRSVSTYLQTCVELGRQKRETPISLSTWAQLKKSVVKLFGNHN